MSVVQQWIAGILGLGALFLVVSNPEGVYKFAQGVRTVVAGSVVDVTTGKSH